MSDSDVIYYRRRAEVELQQAPHREAMLVHFELANAYLDRVRTAQAAGGVADA